MKSLAQLYSGLLELLYYKSWQFNCNYSLLMMLSIFPSVLFLILLSLAPAISSGSPVCVAVFDSSRFVIPVPPLFQNDVPLKIELKAAFIEPNSYRENMRFDDINAKFRQTESVETEDGSTKDIYESASLRYTIDGQPPVELGIEWRTRGRSRRNDPIPPISIRLPEKSKDPLFAGLTRKIKLVLHGSDAPGIRNMTSGASNQLVAGEQMSYKLMEALGIPAVRTRLLHVRLLDSSGQYLTEGTGILLEPTKTLEERLQLKEKKWETEDGDEYILQAKFPVEEYTRQVLAQAMLGHTDWGPAYNTIQMVDSKTQHSTLVGFDFDQTTIARIASGKAKDSSDPKFNQARFISTNANISEIKSWREDQYPNEKLNFNAAFQKMAAEFLVRKATVLDAVNTTPIESRAKAKILAHLEHFFNELAKVKP